MTLSGKDLKSYLELIELATEIKLKLAKAEAENEILKTENNHLKLIISRFQCKNTED